MITPIQDSGFRSNKVFKTKAIVTIKYTIGIQGYSLSLYPLLAVFLCLNINIVLVASAIKTISMNVTKMMILEKDPQINMSKLAHPAWKSMALYGV